MHRRLSEVVDRVSSHFFPGLNAEWSPEESTAGTFFTNEYTFLPLSSVLLGVLVHNRSVSGLASCSVS